MKRKTLAVCALLGAFFALGMVEVEQKQYVYGQCASGFSAPMSYSAPASYGCSSSAMSGYSYTPMSYSASYGAPMRSGTVVCGPGGCFVTQSPMMMHSPPIAYYSSPARYYSAPVWRGQTGVGVDASLNLIRIGQNAPPVTQRRAKTIVKTKTVVRELSWHDVRLNIDETTGLVAAKWK